jgi:hypothetical protein
MKSILAIILIILTVACGEDKAKANEKRTEECRRLIFLAANISTRPSLKPEESAILNNKDVELAYSCSSEDGRSPSCREFYALDSEAKFLTELCPEGFRKFSSRCSGQNRLGECRIFNIQESRWERRVYAKPNDTIESAENDCLLAGGRFTDQNGDNLSLPILIACGLAER